MSVDIVIADDHGVLRGGLRSMLSAEPDLRVVGEAAGGEEALSVIDQVHPDILLADISMPRPNGIELARILSRISPETRVLILSMHEDDSLVREALAAGAWGYIPKRAADAELIRAVRVVAKGDKYGTPAVPPAARQADAGNKVTLDNSERALLAAVASGHSNAQMARELKLSPEELELRKQELYQKLGLRNRVDAVRRAHDHNIL